MYMKRDVYRAMIERSNFRNYLSQYVNPSITRPNFETSRFGSLSTRTKRLRFSFHPIPNRKKSETILVFRLEFRVRIIEFLAWLLGPIAPPFDPSPFHDPSREIAEMRKRNFHLRRSRVFHELFTRVRYSQISSTSTWSLHGGHAGTMGGQIIFSPFQLTVEVLIFGKQYCLIFY